MADVLVPCARCGGLVAVPQAEIQALPLGQPIVVTHAEGQCRDDESLPITVLPRIYGVSVRFYLQDEAGLPSPDTLMQFSASTEAATLIEALPGLSEKLNHLWQRAQEAAALAEQSMEAQRKERDEA